MQAVYAGVLLRPESCLLEEEKEGEREEERSMLLFRFGMKDD